MSTLKNIVKNLYTGDLLVKYLFLIITAVLLFMTMPKGFDTQIGLSRSNGMIYPSSTNADIQKYFGTSDVASYARGGKHYFDTLNFSNYTGFWAPGMFVLHALILLLGINSPAVLFLILTNVLVWSFLIYKIVFLYKEQYKINIWLAFLLPLIIIITPHFRDIFTDWMVLSSEPISIGAFILGVRYSLHNPLCKQSIKTQTLIAGVWFGIAAYFASRNNFVMYVYISISLAYIIGNYLYSLFKNKKSHRVGQASIALLMVCLGFVLVTMPWRIIEPKWVSGNYVFAQVWMDDSQMAAFTLNGGMNAAACKIAPKRCDELRAANLQVKQHDYAWMEDVKNETIKLAFLNPIQWLKIKFPYLIKFWFYEGGQAKINIKNVFNYIYLLGFLTILGIAIFNRSYNDLAIIVPLMSLIIGTLVIHLIIHLEARYLIPIKLLIFYCMQFSIINLIRSNTQKE